MKKTIIFGNNNVAEMIFFETQKYDERHFAIEAFCVDKEYKNSDFFCGKPLLSLDDVLLMYPPSRYSMLSTVLGSVKGLKGKIAVFNRLKQCGYILDNYISPMSDVSPDVGMGENNIIFSLSRIGIGTKMGNSNMIWNGVILDHDASVGDGNFFSAGCKIAGNVNIGDSCWIGINSTIIHRISIADETLVGAGSVITKDTKKNTVYAGVPARVISIREQDEHGLIVDNIPDLRISERQQKLWSNDLTLRGGF